MGLTFILALLVAMLAAIFRAEYDACMPWLAERLRRHALGFFKGALQDRLSEEWEAHLQEVPSPLGKVWHGLGFCVAGWRVLFTAKRRASKRVLMGLLYDAWVAAFHTGRLASDLAFAAPIPKRWKAAIMRPLFRQNLNCVASALRCEARRIDLIEDEDLRARHRAAFAKLVANVNQALVCQRSKEDGKTGPWGASTVD